MAKYCCERFRDAVEDEACIVKAEGYDETEWYINECLHVYFCPFCGKNVKGKGFGEYDIEAKRIKLDEMVKQRRKRK